MVGRAARVLAALSVLLAACASARPPKSAGASQRRPDAAGTPRRVKNVILMLSDGTAPEAWPLTRWVAGRPLAVDGILTGAVRTYGADSIITDSAPGATAYATGFKGTDKGISVGAWRVTIDAARPATASRYRPVATLLEGARLGGRAVGLVATSHVQHATPAAFSAHSEDRSDYADIAEQQVHEQIDVVLAGGHGWLLPKGVEDGRREDGDDLWELLARKGYACPKNGQELAAVTGGKLWGGFADEDLEFDVDRPRLAAGQPSLPEMTRKAIALLASSPKGRSAGFFLFVEGSKVDWAAHSNDPAGVVSELRAFDEAVGAALEFSKTDGDTLLVVVADHGTGGLTIGTALDRGYSQTDDDSVVGPLRAAKVTAAGLAKLLLRGEPSDDAVRKAFADEWGLPSLEPDKVASLRRALEEGRRLASEGKPSADQERPFVKLAAPLLSQRARLGWTTDNHTGADVFLFSYGPDRPSGLWENTALGRLVAERLGIELESVNARLFTEAGPAFAEIGLSTKVDHTDPRNPALVVTNGKLTARLPLSRNVLRIEGEEEQELEGVVVFAKGLDEVFVPRQAVELVRSRL